jgi:hypothetical protein
MRSTTRIDYHWKCDQGIEIPKEHHKHIEDDANKHIFKMISQGYYSGELSTTVRLGREEVHEEEEEGLSYSGHWGVKTRLDY